ncbi:class I tRNA ligase family protein, partial [Pseudomonas sp. DP16D-R1]
GETRAMVAWARDEILKLLHPFMPFITEELWEVTAKRDGLLALAPWPLKPAGPTPEQLAMLAAAAGPTDPLISPAFVMPFFDHADFS